MTTLICEECGKIYHLDSEKLRKRVQGEDAKTRCRECGHLMHISKVLLDIPAVETVPAEQDAEEVEQMPPNTDHEATDFEDSARESQPPPVSRENFPKARGLGIRTKMAILFLIVPLSFLAMLGVLSQRQMNALLNSFSSESVAITKGMAEANVAEISRGVAKRIPMYLEVHPDLEPMDFNYDPEFRKIAIQRIGKTGYTVLIEKPHVGESEYHFRIWVHPEANFVLSGAPLEAMIERMVGPKFKLLFEKIKAGKEIRSNYLWKELNNDLREKFAILVPVEGTDFLVFASIYLDEFLAPVSQLEKDAQSLVERSRNGTVAILVAALLLMGVIILFYGYTLSKNIKTLTDAANKISIGELDTKIQISSADEVGALATAISRMQDSLKLSMARLRRHP